MITVNHLTKVYGSHKAVDDLSFTIEKGKVYGFLGPNGAGKSTTMNILTGCLASTEGEVKIGEFDIFEQPQQAKKLIGYLPELPPLYQDMTPYEYLKFAGQAKGLKGAELKADVQNVMNITKLEDVRSRLIKNLSKGYKQRVGIAMALLGNPEVIILDEPTVGLDPKQIIEIRQLIKSLGESHTVILSSHILSEVSEVCDEILIISHGKLVASDTPENLTKTLTDQRTLTLCVHQDISGYLSEIDGITEVKQNEGEFTYTLSLADEEVPERISLLLGKNGIAIREMYLSKATLEDVFLELTSDTAAEEVQEEAQEEAQEETQEEAQEGGEQA